MLRHLIILPLLYHNYTFIHHRLTLLEFSLYLVFEKQLYHKFLAPCEYFIAPYNYLLLSWKINLFAVMGLQTLEMNFK